MNHPPLEERPADCSRPGPARVVDRHKHRDEIVELLAANWSTRSIDQVLVSPQNINTPVAQKTVVYSPKGPTR